MQNLSEARFREAILYKADLRQANLNMTDLTGAHLFKTNLEKANIVGCRIFEISTWNIQLKDSIQSNLIISDYGDPIITVDTFPHSIGLYR